MTINGRPFSFESRRCVNIPAMPGAVKARVEVSRQQGSDAGNAATCRAIRFFQDPACTGQTLDLLPIIGTQRCAFYPCSHCFHALNAVRLFPTRRWTFSPSWAHRGARHAFYSCSPCFHARLAPMLALLPCSPCSHARLAPMLALLPCSPCSHARLAPMLALLPCSPCSHARLALNAARLLPHLTNDPRTRGALPPPVCSVKYVPGVVTSALCLTAHLPSLPLSRPACAAETSPPATGTTGTTAPSGNILESANSVSESARAMLESTLGVTDPGTGTAISGVSNASIDPSTGNNTGEGPAATDAAVPVVFTPGTFTNDAVNPTKSPEPSVNAYDTYTTAATVPGY
ncbi:unnamed protein product [Closterium sp. Naga37s-1]|nr:unnamed protein product [Closterium sp. Naga37s-1]